MAAAAGGGASAQPAFSKGLELALWAMGWDLHYYAVDLIEYVDTGHRESPFILLSIASAQHLANIMVTGGFQACWQVSGSFLQKISCILDQPQCSQGQHTGFNRPIVL